MAIKRRGARIKGQHRTVRARSASRSLTSAGRQSQTVTRFPVGVLNIPEYWKLGYSRQAGPRSHRAKRVRRTRSSLDRANQLLYGPVKPLRRIARRVVGGWA